MKEIETLGLFRLLLIEMLHRRVEIEKQHYKEGVNGSFDFHNDESKPR